MQVTVSTDWLEKNHQDVIVLDASWYLPSENRDRILKLLDSYQYLLK